MTLHNYCPNCKEFHQVELTENNITREDLAALTCPVCQYQFFNWSDWLEEKEMK